MVQGLPNAKSQSPNASKPYLRAYVFVRNLGGHALDVDLGTLPHAYVGEVLDGEGLVFPSFVAKLLRCLKSFESGERTLASAGLKATRADQTSTHSSGLIALNSTVVSSYGARHAGQRPLRFSLIWW